VRGGRPEERLISCAQLVLDPHHVVQPHLNERAGCLDAQSVVLTGNESGAVPTGDALPSANSVNVPASRLKSAI
jgi:hypothetical protein